MLLKKKERVKFFLKQLIKLRENVQNKTKILKFKKTKWKTFIEHYLKKLKRYKKFKPQDQTRYTVTKYPYKGTSHQKQFRNNLNARRKLSVFYGGLSKTKLKKYVNFFRYKNKTTDQKNLGVLNYIEKRLDTIIFRAKFSKNIKEARQLITHKKILVNNKIIKSPSYQLKTGDLISVKFDSQNLIENNFKYCLKNWIETDTLLWPLPPKHLIINYNTMEIIVENMDITNLSTDFSFNLNLEKIILSSNR